MKSAPLFHALLPLVLCFCTAAALHAQTPAAPPEVAGRKLTVLAKPAKPFVFERGGAMIGYSIELWRRVAQEAGIDFEFKQVPTVPELLNGVKTQQADVGVGAISITAEREAVLDFSHAFFESGLQILAPVEGKSSIGGAFKNLFTKENGLLLGGLLLGLILISHILWFAERSRNAESFPEGYVAGVWEATWWSICTGITGGCENKAPMGVLGRIVAIIWMLAGMALVATVTANLTTTMTVENLVSEIQGMADLKGKTVGSVTGSSAERYLTTRGYQVSGYADVDAAIRGLSAGEVKAVIYDAPILRYYLSENAGARFQLVGEIFDKQNYGFVLQQGSPLRKPINQALLKIAEEGFFDDLDKKWFTSAGK